MQDEIPTPTHHPASTATNPDSLSEILVPAARGFMASLPGTLPKLAIFLGIIVIANVLLMPLEAEHLSPGLASIARILIFLSAAHSPVLGKILFWTIGFIWIRALLRDARRAGPPTVPSRFAAGTRNGVASIRDGIGDELHILVTGVGFGILSAIYLSAQNLARSAPAIVTAAAILYFLGSAGDPTPLALVRAGAKDLGRLVGREIASDEDAARLLLTAVLCGLLMGLFLLLLAVPGPGLVIGALALLGGMAMPFIMPPNPP